MMTQVLKALGLATYYPCIACTQITNAQITVYNKEKCKGVESAQSIEKQQCKLQSERPNRQQVRQR